MIYIADVNVMPLKELLDPQGKAVHHGLNNLGLKAVNDVRIGKRITLKMEADSKEEAERIARTACEKLLANPVMEHFELEVHE
jgi:phosphoribosylformylglycinamidine synthase PurS subunit